MHKAPTLTLLSLVPLTLLVACGSEPPAPELTPGTELSASSQRGANRGDEGDRGNGSRRFSEWSEPVHLGPIVNSPATEAGAELAPDGLSLYFNSTRPNPHCPAGPCDHDIWVSRRACRDCPWEAPVNLGPNINSPQTDGTPAFFPDGHLLFFSSSRDGGQGGEDIWVARRTDKKDDLGWGPPVNLGPGLNTPSHENGPALLPGRAEGGRHTLYFVRGATTAGFDIYQAFVTRDGKPLGPAVPVAELNHPGLDADPTVRADGRELFFWSTSTRPGGEGDLDIWVATRCSVRDPWSTPRSIGPPVNTSFGGELSPALSRDGRTLVFSGNMLRGGSLGRMDLWMSTRTRVGDDRYDDQCGDDADDRDRRR